MALNSVQTKQFQNEFEENLSTKAILNNGNKRVFHLVNNLQLLNTLFPFLNANDSIHYNNQHVLLMHICRLVT